jgi:hypothetical protein
LAPGEGNEYIILKLTFENTTGEQVIVGSFADKVSVMDSAGNKFRDTGMANVEGSNLVVDAAYLAPGGRHTGELAIEVPTDATGLVLEYQLITASGQRALKFQLDR